MDGNDEISFDGGHYTVLGERTEKTISGMTWRFVGAGNKTIKAIPFQSTGASCLVPDGIPWRIHSIYLALEFLAHKVWSLYLPAMDSEDYADPELRDAFAWKILRSKDRALDAKANDLITAYNKRWQGPKLNDGQVFLLRVCLFTLGREHPEPGLTPHEDLQLEMWGQV